MAQMCVSDSDDDDDMPGLAYSSSDDVPPTRRQQGLPDTDPDDAVCTSSDSDDADIFDRYMYTHRDIESVFHCTPSDLGMHWPPKDSLEFLLEEVLDDAGVVSLTACSSHQNPDIETAHACLRHKVRQDAGPMMDISASKNEAAAHPVADVPDDEGNSSSSSSSCSDSSSSTDYSSSSTGRYLAPLTGQVIDLDSGAESIDSMEALWASKAAPNCKAEPAAESPPDVRDLFAAEPAASTPRADSLTASVT